jgi:hypothetical protein
MLDQTKSSQGVAMYAEFRRNASTLQMLITPDGYAESGEIVSAALYRRVVSAVSPKKQWRSSFLRSLGDTLSTPLTSEAEKDISMDMRMSFAVGWLDSLAGGGWVIVKEPILVEASKKDMTDISTQTTPKKMLYRINQSRTALGYPEDLLTPAVAE